MIPVSQPLISELEVDLVADAVRSTWVSSMGPYLDRFEQLFADFCGVKHAVAVCNGTAGLHLALTALAIGGGDEVIVPDLTFVATANAVAAAGAIPTFADVCRDTYCIDPSSVKRLLTKRTKAIIPVHLYGHPADMQAIMKIAETHRLFVIEDAAESHGARIGVTRTGAFGICGVFSFYGNKIVTTGEGGIITTNDDNLNTRLRHLRDHAMSKEIRYWHTELGFNYRMTNLQAALGVAQLSRIDEFLDARDRLLASYKRILEPEGVECNPSKNARPVNWMTTAVVEGLRREQRDWVISEMRRWGIDTRPFFYPMSMLPMYKSASNPVSDQLSASGFNLPTFVGMTDDQVKIVCERFIDALRRKEEAASNES
jgi:perosamine synthetase